MYIGITSAGGIRAFLFLHSDFSVFLDCSETLRVEVSWCGIEGTGWVGEKEEKGREGITYFFLEFVVLFFDFFRSCFGFAAAPCTV